MTRLSLVYTGIYRLHSISMAAVKWTVHELQAKSWADPGFQHWGHRGSKGNIGNTGAARKVIRQGHTH